MSLGVQVEQPQSELDQLSTPASSSTLTMQENAVITPGTVGCGSEEIPDVHPSVNPSLEYSKARKWTITTVACIFTFIVSAATTSYTMGYPSMIRDLNCSESQAAVGLTTYVVAFGATPLVTSAFSEEFGRQPMYWVSVIVFLAMHILIALAPSIAVVSVARLIQGAAGSTGATMVAGTIADIWEAKERGLPMALYSFLAFLGVGAGPIAAGWIEENDRLQWKWIQWISLIICGVYAVVFAFTMRETRASVLRIKAAKRMMSVGNLDDSEKARVALPKQSIRDLLWISCTRPLVLLFSEPIVCAVSIWLAYAWGVFYCMIGTIPSVFKTLHGFSSGEVGTLTQKFPDPPTRIAVCISGLTTLLQERIYLRKVEKRSVEARLYMCCVAGVTFPASIFMFAWFCSPGVHWIFLCLALTIYFWSACTMYLAIFIYLADCYTVYASSALAGQSFLRNVIGGLFPLFTPKIADKLGFTWSNMVYACLALLSAPIPFTVFYLGPRIRRRSQRCTHT